jgi:hypothetical protein
MSRHLQFVYKDLMEEHDATTRVAESEVVPEVAGVAGPPPIRPFAGTAAQEAAPASPKDGDLVCGSCHVALSNSGPIPRTFLGFGRVVCPQCGQTTHYPLTNGTKIFYWVLVAAVTVFCVVELSQGNVALPGLVWIAAVAALVNNGSIERKVEQAWQQHRVKGLASIEIPPPTVEQQAAKRDEIRWYHVLACLLFYVALPWGVANFFMKHRRSGLLMIGSSVLWVVVIFVFAMTAGHRQ